MSTWTEQERREWEAEINGRARGGGSSWEPINLQPIIAGVQAGEIVGPVPRLMERTDAACLLYPGDPTLGLVSTPPAVRL